MGKTIVHGFDENGQIIADHFTTPELITQLIADLPDLCEADIRHRLEEIRESSERDERIQKTYLAVIRERKAADETERT